MPPLNKVVEALKKKQEKGELFGLELLDLIPFENEDISYYMALFEMLKNEKMYNIPGSYLDAHLLVDQEYRDILFRFFDHFMFRCFFIGRDCVDAEVAHKVGRRYTEYTDKDDGSTPTRKSRIRTQEDLDKELDAIKEFIAFLNKTDYRLPIRRDLELSYLLTPFDTYSTTRKMLDEAEELIEMSSSRLFINTHFWILTPYPNTRLRKRYAHLMSDPENYHTQSVLANCWSYELGPQVYFMDKALELRTLKETEDISVYFHEMRKALDDAYAGKLSRKSDAARRVIQ